MRPSDRGDPGAVEGARTAAAIEAFVADISADAQGRTRPPAPSEVVAWRRKTAITVAPETASVPPRAADPPSEAGQRGRSMPLGARRMGPFAWTPPGLADAATWDRSVREESARTVRFGRPVTVVMAELHHLDHVAERLGRDVADRVVSETARLLVAEARAADRLAWLGEARFGVLLLETDELAARGYVDRVRAATDGWLGWAGLSIRLALGWASPAIGGDVVAAAALAEQRMHDASRRTSPGTSPALQARGTG